MKHTILLALLGLSFSYVEAQMPPSFEWGTYWFGNSDGSFIHTTTDPMGNVLVVGGINSGGADTLHNGHQSTVMGVSDGFLIKLDPNGNRIWGTYFGGNGSDELNGVITDQNGNIFVCGSTSSSTGLAQNGFLNTYQGLVDAVLAKFSSSGTLLWATYYGGNDSENARQLTVDKNGNIYIVGVTEGDNGIAYNGHQNTPSIGFNDAFLVKFDSSGNRVWGTYYGGEDLEEKPTVVVDTFGNVYLGGYTTSTQNISYNGHQNTRIGDYDAFIAKFDANGIRKWGTYYGGSGGDGYGETAVDFEGNVYLTGSTDTPEAGAIATPGAHQTNLLGGGDGFLVKFDSTGTRLWGTYIGGNDYDSPHHIEIGPCGNIFLGGSSLSTSGLSLNGFQNSNNGMYDNFVAKLSSDGILLWATYLGGSDSDYIFDMSIGADQSIYLSGNSKSIDLPFQNYVPVAPGGYFDDSFVWKLRENYVSLTVADSSLCADASPIQLVGTPSGGTYSGMGVQNGFFDPIGLVPGQNYLLNYSHTDSLGCPGTGRVEIALNALPNVSFSFADTICEESKIINLNGSPTGGIYSGPGITDTFFDPFAAGQGVHQLTYAYTDSNGCNSDTIIETVLILPNPTPIILAVGDTLTTNLAGLSHTWYLDGVALPDTGSQLISQSTGVYTVVVDNGYCGLFTSESFTHIQTAIESDLFSNVKIWLTPTGQLMLEMGDFIPYANLSLWDLQAKQLWSSDVNQSYSKFDLPSYSAGVYILRFSTPQGSKNVKLLLP
ncbi:MAG: SBBP repeat-containing protein [Bacteroidia bacterium]